MIMKRKCDLRDYLFSERKKREKLDTDPQS